MGRCGDQVSPTENGSASENALFPTPQVLAEVLYEYKLIMVVLNAVGNKLL